MQEHRIILFDGVCQFCNSVVHFVIRNDKRQLFRFAPLQSAAGSQLLKKFDLSTEKFDSFILIEGDQVYTKSTAAIRVLKQLPFPFAAAVVFTIVPLFLRNAVYDVVAHNRYRWFGKRDACMIPNPDVRSRFLD